MKTRIKSDINNLWLISLTLAAAFVLAAGCVAPKPAPDPLVGWKPLYGREYEKVDQAIRSDYQNYIGNLSPEEKSSVGPIFLFEDGAGQRAARITIALNGTVWRHILIYDKDNRRIKTIKYASGNYGS